MASPEAVRAVMEKLRSTLPDTIPKREKDLVRMLRAVRHVNRYPATDTKRGRPGQWKREELLAVGAKLASILERETPSNISFSSFVDHYVRLLYFPTDVLEALAYGQINLFEAAQLARLSPEKMGVSPSQARRRRSDLLASHLLTKLSGESLRQRVAEVLQPKSDAGTPTATGVETDLDDFDPYDPTHLFWDQLKQLGFALRGISREDVTDDEIDELLRASEPVLTILSRIQRRKERKTLKLEV